MWKSIKFCTRKLKNPKWARTPPFALRYASLFLLTTLHPSLQRMLPLKAPKGSGFLSSQSIVLWSWDSTKASSYAALPSTLMALRVPGTTRTRAILVLSFCISYMRVPPDADIGESQVALLCRLLSTTWLHPRRKWSSTQMVGLFVFVFFCFFSVVCFLRKVLPVRANHSPLA